MGLTFTACPRIDPTPDPEPTGPDTKWYVGHESNTSFSLGTANQLAGLAELVNDGINFSGKKIILTKNIDLSTLVIATKASSSTSWRPIGTYDNPFKGTFDGAGYKITGLFIDDGTLEYAGLFGRIVEGKVQNLGVEMATGGITATSAFCVGGVAGVIGGGSIENCYVKGSVSGSGTVGGVVGRIDDNGTMEPIGWIANCYATGTVTGIGNYIGGVIGIIYGDITNCYSTSTVSSTGNYVGGVIGRAHTISGNSMKNCYATGSVSSTGYYVGGVAGGAFCPMENCVALNPKVSGSSFSISGVGRVQGMYGTLTNNVAWEDMIVLVNNAPKTPLANTSTGIDGNNIDTNAVTTQATFVSLGWKFGNDKDNPWKWNATLKRPVLYWE